MKELLTATRMATLLGCPRRHFWRYEIGLKAVTEAQALRFGTAWHAAMEARWQGLAFEAALAAAVKDVKFEEVQLATLSGLLAGYYRRHEQDTVPFRSVVVESDWPEYETVWKMIEDRMSASVEPVKARAVPIELLSALVINTLQIAVDAVAENRNKINELINAVNKLREGGK